MINVERYLIALTVRRSMVGHAFGMYLIIKKESRSTVSFQESGNKPPNLVSCDLKQCSYEGDTVVSHVFVMANVFFLFRY